MTLRLVAQLQPGSLASDFQATDLNGNSFHLFEHLDSGRIVILHCMAAWDSYSWEYYQQQTLESFDAIYGPQGLGSVIIRRVECETQNSYAQLSGPMSLSGNPSTDTWGDWVTGATVPIIDDSTLAAQLALPYLPSIVIICPDRIVRFADQVSLGNLANLVFQSSCTPISTGIDAALVSASSTRICGSNSMEIELVLKNLGTDTLFNTSIELSGATAGQIIPWQGALSSYQSDTITIAGIELLTDAFVTCSVAEADSNTANDTVRVRADVGFSTLLIKLELALDAYPDEITWEIRDDADSVIYSGGGYEVDYQYISNVFQLPAAGCYNFYLNDNRGDGLHGSQYGGFDGFCKLYSMIDSTAMEEEMFFYDGSYNFSVIDNNPSFLQFSFEAGSPLEVLESPRAHWNAFPNPVGNTLFLNAPSDVSSYRYFLLDSFGRKVADGMVRAGERFEFMDVSFLAPGLYSLCIETDKQLTRLPIIIGHP